MVTTGKKYMLFPTVFKKFYSAVYFKEIKKSSALTQQNTEIAYLYCRFVLRKSMKGCWAFYILRVIPIPYSNFVVVSTCR